MYIPKAYIEKDSAEIKTWIKQYPFGILVDQLLNKLWAVHLPFEWEERDGKNLLVGHIARANPIGEQWTETRDVLVIFQGPHTYISSSWYQEEEVPTWDYQAVHLYGQLNTLTEEETMASLHRLVERHEQGEEKPIDLSQFSDRTLRQVRGVIGFEIEINEIQAVSKLSQTRQKDQAEIIRQLEKRKDQNSLEIAQAIRNQSQS